MKTFVVLTLFLLAASNLPERIHGSPVKTLTGESSDPSSDHKKQDLVLSLILKKIDVIYKIIVPTTKAKNCADLYKKGHKSDGIYTIDPDGLGNFLVRCDMTTTGGGWTIFQRRIDGGVDFFRGWQDYKNGFGSLSGEFWLGLDKINRLTRQQNNILRVDMKDFDGNTAYAEYSVFSVSSKNTKYKLSVGTYSGTAGDSFSLHNGMAFSTKDSDNDKAKSNCAQSYKGGWWYAQCHHSNLNGVYHHGKHTSFADGVNWYHWKGYRYSLKKTEMKIRPSGSGWKK